MQDLNILEATAERLQKLLVQGQATSVDLVKLYTDQIAKHDDYLHAMLDVRSADDLHREAAALDSERTSGSVRGPLHGIPIIIKVGVLICP